MDAPLFEQMVDDLILATRGLEHRYIVEMKRDKNFISVNLKHKTYNHFINTILSKIDFLYPYWIEEIDGKIYITTPNLDLTKLEDQQ